MTLKDDEYKSLFRASTLGTTAIYYYKITVLQDIFLNKKLDYERKSLYFLNITKFNIFNHLVLT